MTMANGGGDCATVNIEQLASYLENISLDDPVISLRCSIFRTPIILYRQNEKAYVPNAFSFGPFHHGRASLKRTEKMKLRYLHGLLSRAQDPRKCLRNLMEAIGEIEKEARACYAEHVPYDADELVKMLVVDGCFLVELFRKEGKLVAREPDDPIFTMACMRTFLLHDLVLLENQVPWQVLERLFNVTEPNKSIRLAQLVIAYFGALFSYPTSTIVIEQNLLAGHKTKHILDLLRNWLISPLKLDKKHLGWQPFQSATGIEEAGIKFKRRDEAKSILDIKFKNGVLEIPNLLIYETTEIIFRNLISLEQCAPNYRPIVTSYAVLLDSLINNTKDLDILSKHGIIHSWLNPRDAAQLFSRLYFDANVRKFYYADIGHQVNAYCKRKWPKWRAAYVHNYFGTPWAIVSQVLASILLILAFLQTFYTIKK